MKLVFIVLMMFSFTVFAGDGLDHDSDGLTEGYYDKEGKWQQGEDNCPYLANEERGTFQAFQIIPGVSAKWVINSNSDKQGTYMACLDVDGDGVITTADFGTLSLKAYYNSAVPTNAAGDFNQNGIYDYYDLCPQYLVSQRLGVIIPIGNVYFLNTPECMAFKKIL